MISVWHNRDFIKYALDNKTVIKDIIVSYVATIPTGSPEEAYRLTNHINTDWDKNPDIKVSSALTGKPVRSTSVGDILTHENECLIVDFCGFRELSREEQAEITFNS